MVAVVADTAGAMVNTACAWNAVVLFHSRVLAETVVVMAHTVCGPGGVCERGILVD